MNFRKGRPREDLEINLIPFIDVLLVIVIFLMVTTTYSKFTALQITLPTADAQKALEQPFEINIAVDANGRYAINNKRIAARDAQGLSDEMQAAVKGSGSKLDPVVIINADALATHQTVINVLEAARLAGYPKVTFAAQSSSK
ncbi:biopolymer transporter ExbD [Herbaspirillum rubrisubalbicans]|jgi:biopolymer transport protein ExbD|uniref:Biopolymer transporter ExbD n=2 Tax=Herbaspirillum rubrisubalbicans TaxID=80842 RepID=A0ABX9C4C5_9BURK|nr:MULTISPECIES: biopolymer transporter ExbD [Herbaspirillum]MCP1576489.1 biopolymer transport protein ExbD [Herbaspirillum rubrisubalbicans]NQE49951.1 biopolymer transporter ExbD [Herbaspirillum rubrisubalbicans]QJP99720.1 biopolymer transporter ExbD [Herbaspirillum rubrisubalbicans Os34]RAM65140.1 biopolymer transporter ExbD [Herbaspirillum rubrisubalbicans]RAN48772.1 biopolymer transporter ExbD [Herbaspirillum rubrisubalbicans]